MWGEEIYNERPAAEFGCGNRKLPTPTQSPCFEQPVIFTSEVQTPKRLSATAHCKREDSAFYLTVSKP
jgi:hypothetical protein